MPGTTAFGLSAGAACTAGPGPRLPLGGRPWGTRVGAGLGQTKAAAAAGPAVAPSRERPWRAATPSAAAAVGGCGAPGGRAEGGREGGREVAVQGRGGSCGDGEAGAAFLLRCDVF